MVDTQLALAIDRIIAFSEKRIEILNSLKTILYSYPDAQDEIRRIIKKLQEAETEPILS